MAVASAFCPLPLVAERPAAHPAGLLRDAQVVFDPGECQRTQGLAQAALAQAKLRQGAPGLQAAQALALLALCEAALGPDHPGTAASRRDLGLTDSALGHIEQALPPLQRALATSESLRAFRSCPLITPKHACSSLQMLAIAQAMAALCALIGRVFGCCSGTLEILSAF